MDGPTDTTDHDLTENNRALVRSFIETVFVDGQLIRLKDFVDEDSYAEHNPRLGDGVTMLRAALEAGHDGRRRMDYHRTHRVLPKEALCSASARETMVAFIPPSMIFFGWPMAK